MRDPRIVIVDLDDAQYIDRRKRFITGSKSYRAPEVYGGKPLSSESIFIARLIT